MSIEVFWRCGPQYSQECLRTADFKEKTAQILPLPEKKASEIREMLLVIYPTSAKQIDDSNYHFLLNLAEEYMMKSLVEKCEQYLIKCLKWPRQSSLLCLDLLDIAQEYKLEKLQMACIDKARNLSFWKLKEDSMYSKMSLSNFQQIIERMIQQLESEIQQLRRRLNAVDGQVRQLHRKFTEFESDASGALTEFTKLASILVHVASRRAKDSKFDQYEGYISTESLDEKLNFISKADGFEELETPLYNLRRKLEKTNAIQLFSY